MSLRNGAGPAPAATGGEARKNVGSGNARSSKAHSQKVRAAMGATGDVSKLDTREDSKGRHQPARKAERPKRTPQEQRAAIDGAVEGIQRGHRDRDEDVPAR